MFKRTWYFVTVEKLQASHLTSKKLKVYSSQNSLSRTALSVALMEFRITDRIECDNSNIMSVNYLINDETIIHHPSVTSSYRQGSRVLTFEQILVRQKCQKLLNETFGFMKSFAHHNRAITRKVFDGLKRWMIASKYLRAHEAIKHKQAESYVPRVACIHTASSFAKFVEQTSDVVGVNNSSTSKAARRTSSVRRPSRTHIDFDNQSETGSVYRCRSRERSGSILSMRSQQSYSAASTASAAVELGGFPTAAVRALASHCLYNQIHHTDATATQCSSSASVLGLPLVKASLHLPLPHSSSVPAATALSPTGVRSPGSISHNSSIHSPYSISSRARESPLRSLLRPVVPSVRVEQCPPATPPLRSWVQQGVENSLNLSNHSNQGSPSAAEIAFARSRGSSCSLDPAVPRSPLHSTPHKYAHIVQSPSAAAPLDRSSPLLKIFEASAAERNFLLYRHGSSSAVPAAAVSPVSKQRDSSSAVSAAAVSPVPKQRDSNSRFSVRALHEEDSHSTASRAHTDTVTSAKCRSTSKLQAALSSFRAAHKAATTTTTLHSLTASIRHLAVSPIPAYAKSDSSGEASFDSSASAKSDSSGEASFDSSASTKSDSSGEASFDSSASAKSDRMVLLRRGFCRLNSKVVQLQEWRTRAVTANSYATDYRYNHSLRQGLSRLRRHTYSSYSCSAELARSAELQVATESWQECVLTRFFWQLRRNVTKTSRQRYLQRKGSSYYKSLSLSTGYSALLYLALRGRKRRIGQPAPASSENSCSSSSGVSISMDSNSRASSASTHSSSRKGSEDSNSMGSGSCGYSSDFESEGTPSPERSSPIAVHAREGSAAAERSPEEDEEMAGVPLGQRLQAQKEGEEETLVISKIEDEQAQESLQDLENTLPTGTTNNSHSSYSNSTVSTLTAAPAAEVALTPVLHASNERSGALEVTFSPEPAPRPPLGIVQQTALCSSSTPLRRHSTGNQPVLLLVPAVTVAVLSNAPVALSPLSPKVIPASTDASEHPSAILLEAADSHRLDFADDCGDSVASGSDLSMFLSSDSDSSSMLEAESLSSLQRSGESECAQQSAVTVGAAASEIKPVGQSESLPPLPLPSLPLSPSSPPPPPLPESPPPLPFSSVLREAVAYRRFTQLRQGLYALSQWVLRSQSLASMNDILFEYRCARKMRLALKVLRAKAML